MSAKNRAIVDQVNAAFRENSVEGFLALCTDDVEWTMVGEKAIQGKETIRTWMASGPKEPPQFTVVQVICEGDLAAAYGDMTMTENGKGVVPYSYCDVYRFKDGKVAELRSYVVKTQASVILNSGQPTWTCVSQS